MNQNDVQKLRKLIGYTIVVVFAGNVVVMTVSMIGDFFSWTLGVVILFATLFCNFQANKHITPNVQYYFWRFIVPAVVIVIPFLSSWLSSDEGMTLSDLWFWAKLTILIILPVGMLSFVYIRLDRLHFRH